MAATPETPREFDPNTLLEPSVAHVYAAYEPKIGSLPFDQVPWPVFEKISARLLEAVYKGKFLQAFTYGSPGQEQYGIDVIAWTPGALKQTVMQCKHVRQVQRGQLKKWVASFSSGKKCADAERYILCLACPIESDNKLVEEWSEQTRLLQEKGVAADLWSRDKLNALLRDEPGLVTEFFGNSISVNFCAHAPTPDRYPARYRREFESNDGNYFVFENETVRFDLFVPDERRPRVSALISFARADLSGITFTIPGATLVDWLQWIGHANDLSKAPYASPVSGVESRYIFCAPDARLSLDDSELIHIHWILFRAWQAYNDATKAIESRWRFLRFDPIDEAHTKTFAMAKISHEFWEAILAFARDHDSRHGDSHWHIFEGTSGALKVFVDASSERLARGYHLIMYAYQKGGINLPHEDKILLGWAPLTSISDDPVDMHPRLAWDAEFTHGWIFGELVPAIRKWIEAKQNKENSPTGMLAKFVPRHRARAQVDLSSHIYSLERLPVRSMSSSAVTLPELREYADVLQSYFCVYRRTAQLSEQQVRSVLDLLIRLVPMIQAPDKGYIRSNLGLGEGTLQTELAGLAQYLAGRSNRSIGLDMLLRSLTALLHDANFLPPSELVLIIEALVPLWDRMAEDRRCDGLR